MSGWIKANGLARPEDDEPSRFGVERGLARRFDDIEWAMSDSVPTALHFVLLVFAGWVNREQQKVVEYLLEQNRVLQEQLGGRRLQLDDEQRRRSRARQWGIGAWSHGTPPELIGPVMA